MRRMAMYKRVIRPDRGGRMTLIYSVTVDALGDSPAAGIESYGVSITDAVRREETAIRNITLNSAEIFSLARLLADNGVTPVTLQDVVYDWICRI